jgi:hypothetical protein
MERGERRKVRARYVLTCKQSLGPAQSSGTLGWGIFGMLKMIFYFPDELENIY